MVIWSFKRIISVLAPARLLISPHETPPASPYMEEEIVEGIDDFESSPNGEIEILESYDVEEVDENDDFEEMSVNEVEEVMVREDAVCIFEQHNASVFCGCLSKDGQYAVTGGEDDKAYVWNTKTGEVLLICNKHKDSVIFADFSYDNMYLATGDMKGIIQIWKEMNKNIVWDYNMGDATWMQWHSMAHVLLAGSVEGEIYMWKMPEGDCKIVQGFGNRAETAVLMPDGKRLVVGYEDGVIRIIDLKSCTITATIPSNIGHNAAVTSLDCHLDNNLILSGAVDGKSIVSATHTGKVLSVLQNIQGKIDEDNEDNDFDGSNGNWVEAVAFLKDISKQIAATGTVNGDIFIWDISKKMLRHRIDQGSGVSKLLWKENTSLLFSAGLDGIMRCYDTRTGECIRTFLGHTKDILDVCLSKDGQIALTTSDDTTARIFKLDEF